VYVERCMSGFLSDYFYETYGVTYGYNAGDEWGNGFSCYHQEDPIGCNYSQFEVAMRWVYILDARFYL